MYLLWIYFGGMIATGGTLLSAAKLQQKAGVEPGPVLHNMMATILWPIFSFGELFTDD